VKVFVIDTSVAIAWYLEEKFSSSAREWQRRFLQEEITLIAPSLHYLEFGNVLRTYVRKGELDQILAVEIFQLHLDAPLQKAEPDRMNVFRRALEFHATVYDAVYIELALSLDAPLLTAERTTTPWVVKLGKKAKTVS
jgi:predicted nucleic acid-binding protein